jgi:hypothetical protein
VDIETLADGGEREEAARVAQVLRRGDLHVGALTLHDRDALAGGLHDGGVVRRASGGGGVGGEEGAEEEALRRLRAREPLARNGARDGAVRDALQRVGDGDGRDRRRRAGERGDDAVDQPVRHEGAGAVVDEDGGGRVCAHRLERGADARLPRLAPGDPGDTGSGCLEKRRIVGIDGGDHAADGRVRGKRRRRTLHDGAPAEGEELLRRLAAEAGAAAGGDDDGVDGVRNHRGGMSVLRRQ